MNEINNLESLEYTEDYEIADMPKKGDRCVVALSGGLDSTYCAKILLDRGCTVIGATMDIIQDDLLKDILDKIDEINKKISDIKKDDLAHTKKKTLFLKTHEGGACFSPSHKKDIDDCRQFCESHEIPYYVIDLKNAYKKEIIDYVTKSYLMGVTPNPCVVCNERIKFGAFLDALRKKVDFDYFCTGHYAAVVKSKRGHYSIKKALDDKKDQTYFLYRLPQEVLKITRFPLYLTKKSDVKKDAERLNLAVAKKRESEDFATGVYFSALFPNGGRAGNIVDTKGTVIGRHTGLENYTIGKRRAIDTKINTPLYTLKINTQDNSITVGEKEMLLSDGCEVGNFLWKGGDLPLPLLAYIKVRLAATPVLSLIKPIKKSIDDKENYIVEFSTPISAVAPGQSLVLYDKNDIILGGGVIKSVLKKTDN